MEANYTNYIKMLNLQKTKINQICLCIMTIKTLTLLAMFIIYRKMNIFLSIIYNAHIKEYCIQKRKIKEIKSVKEREEMESRYKAGSNVEIQKDFMKKLPKDGLDDFIPPEMEEDILEVTNGKTRLTSNYKSTFGLEPLFARKARRKNDNKLYIIKWVNMNNEKLFKEEKSYMKDIVQKFFLDGDLTEFKRSLMSLYLMADKIKDEDEKLETKEEIKNLFESLFDTSFQKCLEDMVEIEKDKQRLIVYNFFGYLFFGRGWYYQALGLAVSYCWNPYVGRILARDYTTLCRELKVKTKLDFTKIITEPFDIELIRSVLRVGRLNFAGKLYHLLNEA